MIVDVCQVFVLDREQFTSCVRINNLKIESQDCCYVRVQVADFRFRDQPPLSSASWFKAIYRRFDSEQFPNEFPSQGFKSALLIRLAPVLPVPVDAHWYILGTTNLKLAEFALAHLMGVFKVSPLSPNPRPCLYTCFGPLSTSLNKYHAYTYVGMARGQEDCFPVCYLLLLWEQSPPKSLEHENLYSLHSCMFRSFNSLESKNAL